MSVAPEQNDSARHERALDRLAAHCELAVSRATVLEDKRVSVRARLERELGPDLARVLLAGLAA